MIEQRRSFGSGSVEPYDLKDGTTLWCIRYWTLDKYGNKVQRKESRFPNKTEAKDTLAERIHQLKHDTFVAPDKQTFQQYTEAWLQRKDDTTELQPSTVASYSKNLRLHIFPALGRLKLQEVTPVAIKNLLADRTKAGLSRTTVRYLYAILSSIFKEAIQDGLLSSSPLENVTKPDPARKVKRTVWTPEQVKEFLAATADTRRGPLWRLLFTTGLRRGEALGLSWADLDLDEGTVTVTRSLTDADFGIPVFSDPKTEDSSRTITLDPVTVAVLRSLKVGQAAERLALGAGYIDHGLVFCFEDGRPYHPDRVTRVFQDTHTKMGLPKIRLHDTRHWAATLMIQKGVPINVVQERLGHSNPMTTLTVYAHVVKGQDRAASDSLAAVIA